MVSFYEREVFKQISEYLKLAESKPTRSSDAKGKFLCKPLELHESSSSGPRSQEKQRLVAWFESLSVNERMRAISVVDRDLSGILLQLYLHKQRSGNFYIYFKPSCEDFASLSSLFYTKPKRTFAEFEQEVENSIRLTDTHDYLDTITLSPEFLSESTNFFRILNTFSKGKAFERACRQTENYFEYPNWLLYVNTLPGLVCYAFERALWRAYWIFEDRSEVEETGYTLKEVFASETETETVQILEEQLLEVETVFPKTKDFDLRELLDLQSCALTPFQRAATSYDVLARKRLLQKIESQHNPKLDSFHTSEDSKSRAKAKTTSSTTSTKAKTTSSTTSNSSREDACFIREIVLDILYSILNKVEKKPELSTSVSQASTVSKKYSQVFQKKKQKKKKTRNLASKRSKQIFPVFQKQETKPKIDAPAFKPKPIVSTSEQDFPPLVQTDQLHSEIVNFVKTTQEKVHQKSQVICLIIEQLRMLLNVVIPGCQVFLYGSYATGLALESSDVDLQVYHPSFVTRQAIEVGCMQIANHLAMVSWASSPQSIHTASIPLVKAEVDLSAFSGKETDGFVSVDITFDDSGRSHLGAYSLSYSKRLLQTHPSSVYITIVLKALLAKHALNCTYKGGLGSNSLFIWVIAFLNDHKKGSTEDYGKLLMDILWFYGNEFDYKHLGICVQDNGSFFPIDGQFGIVTLDLANHSNNTTRTAYNVTKVLQLFSRTHATLQNLKNSGHARDLLSVVFKYKNR